jgi:hypothetical protein
LLLSPFSELGLLVQLFYEQADLLLNNGLGRLQFSNPGFELSLFDA